MSRKHPEPIGQRIFLARTRLELTQGDLHTLTTIHQTALSHFESGRREPNLKNLVLLCKALKVSSDWILGLPERKHPKESNDGNA